MDYNIRSQYVFVFILVFEPVVDLGNGDKEVSAPRVITCHIW